MNRERKEAWLEFVSNNFQRLENAVNEYRQNPSIIRHRMAEQGIEVTPEQLNDLIDLIRESLDKNN